MRSNVTELGGGAMFVGITFALIGVAITLASDEASLASASMLVWLGTCFTFIILGGLTLKFRNRPLVVLTTTSIVLGLGFDLLLSLSVGKLIVSGGIIVLVLKTAKAALGEINSRPSNSHQPNSARPQSPASMPDRRAP